MASLSDDELTCLLIAAEGESLMPIGRWKPAVESLIERGMLKSHDRFNNTITDAGRVAIGQRNAEDEGAIRQASRQVADAQGEARKAVEEAAQALARAAKASVRATGDRADAAVLNWNGEVIRRALELVSE